MLERFDIEIAAQARVDHRQHVSVELRRHAGRVVVRRYQHVRVDHEPDAEQQVLAGAEGVRDGSEKLPAFLGNQVAEGSAQERNGACPVSGEVVQRVGEIADDAAHLEGRELLRDLFDGTLERCDGYILRHIGLQRTVLHTGGEQDLRLLRRTRAQLDQHRRFRRLGDIEGMFFQERPLGASGVVLRQHGDLLEQLAAQRVVEVLRREPLRRGRQPIPHVLA